MSVQVQYRRGTAVENNSFTGAYGEITVDTTNWTLRVQDGATAGGFSTVGLATTQTLTNKTLVAPSLQGTTTAAVISASGNITASNFIGNVVGNISGNLTAPGANTQVIFNDAGIAGASANLTFNGTTLAVTGTAQATTFSGSGAQLSALPGANVTGTVANATYATSAGSATTATSATSATTAGTVTTAAQPNITSVGTLTSLTVSGDATAGGVTLSGNTIVAAGPTLTIDPNGSGGTAGNVIVAGNLQVQGNLTYVDVQSVTTSDLLINVANNAINAAAANGAGIGVGPIAGEYASFTYNSTSNTWVISNGANVSGALTVTGVITGNGSGLTSLTGSAVTGTVANATYATSAGSATTATSATTAATVTTAAQPNITSVGTLSSLTVTGNVAAGNLSGTSIVGTLTTAAQTNITSVGTLGSLAVTANVTGGNLLTAGLISATGQVTGSQFNGSGAGLSSLPGANVTGTLSVNTTGSAATLTTSRNINGVAFNGSADITVTAAAGTLTGTTLNSTVVTSSLTTVGALNSGSITSGFGAIDIGTDSVTCGSIVNANANGVGNIGSSTTYFNTVFAKATSAQYADLAEVYAADADYAPGTVVVFGGEKEITTTTTSHDAKVAGVISTDPAYLMNSGAQGLPVAFTGRVPTLVQGPIAKGEIVVTSSIAGVGQRLENWVPGCVIGKSLENIEGNETRLIEVVVGRF